MVNNTDGAVIHLSRFQNTVFTNSGINTVWTIEIGVRGGHPPFDYRVK